MNESLFEKLIEISWKRALTPEEERQLQRWLAEHPADAERWEMEFGLNTALDRLETVAPSSNFTRQVLQLVEAEQRAAQRQPGLLIRLRALWRRPYVVWATALLLVFAVIQFGREQLQTQTQITRGMEYISTVAAVAAPEVLEDFDAIRELSLVRTDRNPTDDALFILLGQ
jgi:anti-sigma factor RsiW